MAAPDGNRRHDGRRVGHSGSEYTAQLAAGRSQTIDDALTAALPIQDTAADPHRNPENP
jgi:hypothetical protein